MKRYWINQPSTLQPCHSMHGQNVLSDLKPVFDGATNVTVYFAQGEIISAVIPKLALSEGWKTVNN